MLTTSDIVYSAIGRQVLLQDRDLKTEFLMNMFPDNVVEYLESMFMDLKGFIAIDTTTMILKKEYTKERYVCIIKELSK